MPLAPDPPQFATTTVTCEICLACRANQPRTEVYPFFSARGQRLLVSKTCRRCGAVEVRPASAEETRAYEERRDQPCPAFATGRTSFTTRN